MAENHESTEAKDPASEQQVTDANLQSSDVVEGEFKVTVRKLEMPVRPRGVLAE